MRSLPSILVLACCAVGPCAVGSVIRDDGTDLIARNLGGQPAFASAARFNVAGGVGSGTLVAPEWVLTAAHVVTNSSGTPLPLGSISVTVNGESRAVSAVVTQPGWTGGNFTAGVDLALVRLSAPVASVAPAERINAALTTGQQLTIIGYGAFGFGSTGLTDPPGVLRGVTNAFDGLAPSLYPAWSPSLGLMDFDSPLNASYNRSGENTATDLEGSLATGDSGGGSFALVDGIWRLTGVHSFTFTTAAGAAAPFGYGTGSADVLVANSAAWIDSVIPTPGTGGVIAAAALLTQRRRRA